MTLEEDHMSHPSTPPTVIATLDIAKHTHWFAVFAPDLTPIIPPHPITTDATALQSVITTLAQLALAGPVALAMEPTSIYHLPWLHALTAALPPTVTCLLVHTTAVHHARTRLTAGRLRKTDARDCHAIAAAVRDGHGRPWSPPSPQQAQFRTWAAQEAATMETLTQLAHALQRLTDLLWPGLVARRNAASTPLVSSRLWTRHIIQTILLHHPDPHTWRSLSVAAIRARLKALGMRCGIGRATHLAAILAAQVVLPPEQTPPLAARLTTLMQQYCHHATHLAALHAEAETLVAASWAAVLCSIPGMSPVLAARYAAAVGDIHTITSAKALWSLAGLEPSIYASGVRSRVGQSSLAGRITLRQALIRIGASLSRHCPPVRACWLAARARRKPLAVALIHAANKANRLLFALAISQQPYQPGRA